MKLERTYKREGKMFKVELSFPMVNLIVNKKVVLDRKIRKVWDRDTSVREAVSALAVEQYYKDTGVMLGDETDESGLIGFLNWLLENQDKIIAFIKIIMSLFTAEV